MESINNQNDMIMEEKKGKNLVREIMDMVNGSKEKDFADGSACFFIGKDGEQVSYLVHGEGAPLCALLVHYLSLGVCNDASIGTIMPLVCAMYLRSNPEGAARVGELLADDCKLLDEVMMGIVESEKKRNSEN